MVFYDVGEKNLCFTGIVNDKDIFFSSGREIK